MGEAFLEYGLKRVVVGTAVVSAATKSLENWIRALDATRSVIGWSKC